MSCQVRDEQLQPPDPAVRSRLLSSLYAAQERYGYLSEEALRDVADELRLSLKDVYSTATFYSLYHLRPSARYVILVCEGLSCHLAGGAERLVDHIRRRLEIGVGQTTQDGLFGLETVQCLASCKSSPNLRINDDLYRDMTPEKVDRLLEELAGR